jgi:hypothetical protein
MVTGLQLVTDGLLSREYAHIPAFLPAPSRSDWLIRNISTDRLALGAGIIFGGGGLFFGYALARWAQLGFGPLNEPEIPRIVILGLSLIVIGLQLFFSAFLLGVLEIPVSSRRIGAAPGRTSLRPAKVE